jgi:hypothetical protein
MTLFKFSLTKSEPNSQKGKAKKRGGKNKDGGVEREKKTKEEG